MEMTENEIVKRFKSAKERNKQIGILADLNNVSRDSIVKIVKANGFYYENGEWFFEPASETNTGTQEVPKTNTVTQGESKNKNIKVKIGEGRNPNNTPPRAKESAKPATKDSTLDSTIKTMYTVEGISVAHIARKLGQSQDSVRKVIQKNAWKKNGPLDVVDVATLSMVTYMYITQGLSYTEIAEKLNVEPNKVRNYIQNNHLIRSNNSKVRKPVAKVREAHKMCKSVPRIKKGPVTKISAEVKEPTDNVAEELLRDIANLRTPDGRPIATVLIDDLTKELEDCKEKEKYIEAKLKALKSLR